MFNGQYSTDYGALFAATAISIIPVLLIYLFFQKQFIAGIAASAVKDNISSGTRLRVPEFDIGGRHERSIQNKNISAGT